MRKANLRDIEERERQSAKGKFGGCGQNPVDAVLSRARARGKSRQAY
jgi:hypothetical protein